MSVYMIIEAIEVKDRERYGEYVAQVKSLVESYRGKYLSRGGNITPLVGDWNPLRMVLIEFPDMSCLQGCFGCDEYQKLAPLREASAKLRAVVLDDEVKAKL